MLHIIQSRHPIRVLDLNICVVGVKMTKVSVQNKYEKIYIKAAQNKEVHAFNISGIGMQRFNKKQKK